MQPDNQASHQTGWRRLPHLAGLSLVQNSASVPRRASCPLVLTRHHLKNKRSISHSLRDRPYGILILVDWHYTRPRCQPNCWFEANNAIPISRIRYAPKRLLRSVSQRQPQQPASSRMNIPLQRWSQQPIQETSPHHSPTKTRTDLDSRRTRQCTAHAEGTNHSELCLCDYTQTHSWSSCRE